MTSAISIIEAHRLSQLDARSSLGRPKSSLETSLTEMHRLSQFVPRASSTAQPTGVADDEEDFVDMASLRVQPPSTRDGEAKRPVLQLNFDAGSSRTDKLDWIPSDEAAAAAGTPLPQAPLPQTPCTSGWDMAKESGRKSSVLSSGQSGSANKGYFFADPGSSNMSRILTVRLPSNDFSSSSSTDGGLRVDSSRGFQESTLQGSIRSLPLLALGDSNLSVRTNSYLDALVPAGKDTADEEDC
jgi:hypothetical protein